jgi:four helix bundle protein
MEEKRKINYFTDLDAWKEGHKLVLQIYKTTKRFPTDERYALADQMKRAAVSITSNIAEGFSRQSYKEKIQFYSTSLDSVTETQNQLFVARDVNYTPNEEFSVLFEQSIKVRKIINGLIKSSKNIVKNF